MTFNSPAFAAFIPVVYLGYLLLQGRRRGQNAWLLGASLVFYAHWDWRFLGLLLGTALVDYVVARAIHGSIDPRRRRLLLTTSLVSNLGVLAFFKYFNFFADSVARLLSIFGEVHPFTLEILLPVGISFYTFQSISYVVDVYRGEVVPAADPLDFFLFVAFFPHMVAGPIMHANALLPQMQKPRRIVAEQVNAAVFLLLWGYFKKMVIADNCALVANEVFGGYERYHGLDLLCGMLAFTVQIYADFSGYSDIARGLAKLMGFELMVNFRLPYFATSPSDFWRRWHISLSTWLRDYLYVPLGGNRRGPRRTYVNLALTMLLGGLWHGAAWNYVLWGAYHGALLILERRLGRRPWSPPPGAWLGPVRVLAMFALTVVGWVLFRSRSAGQVVYMLTNVGLAPSASSADLLGSLLFFALPLLLVQLFQQWKGDLLALTHVRFALRVPLYAALLVGIVVLGVRDSIEFIYFQF